MKKIFIHTNNKQLVGAIVSKHSIEKKLSDKSITVEFINSDEIPQFKNFAGKTYLFAGETRTYDPKDLQSFTLSRFMAVERMNYDGLAVVIDPDIFALQDPSELFNFDLKGKAIASCTKKGAWDTSVMLLDCAKLKHWNMSEFLNRLAKHEVDYTKLMTLQTENQDLIIELPRIWNNLDTLTPETKMIHMTGRLTQPWKTGLKIDFTRNKMPKIFGIIPREPIHKLLGKYDTHYQKHPDQRIEDLFISLSKDAYKDGALTKEIIQQEINSKHVRADMLTLVTT
jgi:hypothetical protein